MRTLIGIALLLAVNACSLRPDQSLPVPPPGGPMGATPATAAPPAPGGDLGALDRLFLDNYRKARAVTARERRPVVIVSGSNLILHTTGSTLPPVRVIPAEYHALKSIAHTPLGIYLRLRTELDTPLSADTRAALEAILDLLPRAERHLRDFDLTSEQLTRQSTIVEETRSLLHGALVANRMTAGALRAYTRRLGPLLLENTRDAGCAQVVGTHAQMRRWQEEYPDEPWEDLIVVNSSTHQARFRNAATLYFAWTLRDEGQAWSYPGEGMRVVYAETLFGGSQPLDLMATVVLDADASDAFFGNEWRLSEDVLSDGAADCVARLPDAERIRR